MHKIIRMKPHIRKIYFLMCIITLVNVFSLSMYMIHFKFKLEDYVYIYICIYIYIYVCVCVCVCVCVYIYPFSISNSNQWSPSPHSYTSNQLLFQPSSRLVYLESSMSRGQRWPSPSGFMSSCVLPGNIYEITTLLPHIGDLHTCVSVCWCALHVCMKALIVWCLLKRQAISPPILCLSIRCICSSLLCWRREEADFHV